MHSRWSQVCSLELHVQMSLCFISVDALPDSVWPIRASITVKICHMPDSFCRHSSKKRCVHRDVIGFSSTMNINKMDIDTQRYAWVYSKMRCIASCSISIKVARHMERRKPFHFLHEFMCGRSQVLVSHIWAIVAWRRGGGAVTCFCFVHA
jgi:hypothetical protein